MSGVPPIGLFKLMKMLAPPSQANAYQALLQKQLEDGVFAVEKIGTLNFINNGLRLEREQ